MDATQELPLVDKCAVGTHDVREAYKETIIRLEVVDVMWAVKTVGAAQREQCHERLVP